MPNDEKNILVQQDSVRGLALDQRATDVVSSVLTGDHAKSALVTESSSGPSSAAIRIPSPDPIASLRTDDSQPERKKVTPKIDRSRTQAPDPRRRKVFVGSGRNLSPLSEQEVRKELEKVTVYVGEGNEFYATYSTAEAAEKLSVDIATITKWIKARRLVGFKKKSGEWRIPKVQIRQGQIAPDLDKVADFFGDSVHLWHYLVKKQLLGDERIRPLELHFRNEIEFAVGLAKGYGMEFM